MKSAEESDQSEKKGDVERRNFPAGLPEEPEKGWRAWAATTGAIVVLLLVLQLLTGTLLAFYYGYAIRGSVELGRGFAFTTLVYAELLRSLGARSPEHHAWDRTLGPNRLLLGIVGGSMLLQVTLHHIPVLQTLFGTAPAPLSEGLAILALGTVPLIVLEARKALRRRQNQRSWRNVAH